jgi:hypothetical protein
VNEVCTTTEMPAPLDWATDVDGAVPFAPIMLVNHGRIEHIITLAPTSHVPCDFSALHSSTRNPWASLRHCHHCSHPCIHIPFNACKYTIKHKTPAPPSPVPIQHVETVRHPHRIGPTKPVIKKTSSASAVAPSAHSYSPTPLCALSSCVDLDSSLQHLSALSLDWSGDPLLAGLARILEALGWTRDLGAARTPLCLRGADGVVDNW